MHSLLKLCACLILLLAVGTAVSRPARAAFGDCNSADYMARFDPRFATGEFLCVETDRLPVTSDAGVSYVRIIQHLEADWATRPGAMRSIKDGVAASIRAMGSLGHFRIPDVTILLVDGFAPPTGRPKEDFGEIAAGTGMPRDDECIIVVYLLGAGATASYGGSTIAHELFHCVQNGSLSAAQIATSGGGTAGGGNWWVEGSADWFSTLALPAPAYMADRVRAFDHNSPTVALNGMSYQGYVFFAWLGGRARGLDQVVPFMQQMATSANQGAQRAAMMRALPADEWLHFAEDYLDQRIVDGQRVSIGSTPTSGETLEWTATQTRRIDLAPFVIARRNIAFQCGQWTIEPRPARSHAVSRAAGEAWSAFPDTLDNLAHDRGDYRFAGMNATAEAVPLQVAGTLTARCQECAGTRQIDSCMVGTWTMSADGALQWMHEHLPNLDVTNMSRVGNTITFNNDGTFVTGASRVAVSGSLPDGTRGTGRLNGQSSGRWSSGEGQINYCTDTGAVNGTTTAVVEGRSVTVPLHVDIPPVASNAYSCAGDTFTATTPMGGHGSVVSTYTRTH